MEILLFTMVGIILYVTSDAIVKAIEKKRGELLPNRSVIFFGIILVMSVVTFNLLKAYGPQLGLLPASEPAQEKLAPAPEQTDIPQAVPVITAPEQK